MYYMSRDSRQRYCGNVRVNHRNANEFITLYYTFSHASAQADCQFFCKNFYHIALYVRVGYNIITL